MKKWSLVSCLAACCLTTAVIAQSLPGDHSMHLRYPERSIESSKFRPDCSTEDGDSRSYRSSTALHSSHQASRHESGGIVRFPNVDEARSIAGENPRGREDSNLRICSQETRLPYASAFDSDSELIYLMLPEVASSHHRENDASERSLQLNSSSAFSEEHSQWTGKHILRGAQTSDSELHQLSPSAQSQGLGEGWLEAYQYRIDGVVESPRKRYDGFLATIPDDFVPWWQAYVTRPSDANAEPIWVGVDGLVDSALAYSPYVKGLFMEPHIRDAIVVEEYGSFDWTTFLESTFKDLNEPIGNTLTTGNNEDRFKEHDWSFSGGVRRTTPTGAELEVSQVLRRQSNNSSFLDPNPQANSRLEVSFIQPLLNGGGREFNRSRILLASIDAETTDDQVADKLQDHLVRVAESYWELFRARSELIQRKRVLDSAVVVLENLTARGEVDALNRQILRAQAAVATRRSDIARSENSVRVAETQLRLLVNDPLLLQRGMSEFMPVDAPSLTLPHVGIRDGLTTALIHRPDISAAIQDMNASLVRLGVAKHNILPKLELVLSTRVDGVEGQSALASSFGNQFADGRPSYTAGFQFEVPIGNRLSKAQRERREWEAESAFCQFQTTVERSLTNVETSIRELHTTHREMLGKYYSMVAAQNEVAFLEDRWRTLPGIDDSATLLLEDLLESQERLVDEEAAFVRAQVGYSMAYVMVRREIGTLLRVEQGITSTQSDVDDTSRVRHETQMTPLPQVESETEPERALPNPNEERSEIGDVYVTPIEANESFDDWT